MAARRSHAAFWLVDQNPLNLPEPPRWWQRAVQDYDKFLRLMPSQVDRCYRLCRVARRESRLGLKLASELHRHPDTVAMAKFGVVPELTLQPHAIFSQDIVGLLRACDTWRLYGGDPEKRLAAIEQAEAAEAAVLQQAHDAEQSEVLSDTYRHIRMGGYRPHVHLTGDRPLRPLPALPATLPPVRIH